MSIVFLGNGCRSKVVEVDKIETIEVSTNDLTVRLSGENEPVVVRGSLKRCMQKLPMESFFMASRCCLVNLLHVDKVDAASRNILFWMKNGGSVTVSRKQSIVFRKEFAL